MFLKTFIKNKIEKATNDNEIKVLKEIEKYIDDNGYDFTRIADEIVEIVSKITNIDILPKDENDVVYNETGQKLFNAIYEIIKNYLQ